MLNYESIVESFTALTKKSKSILEVPETFAKRVCNYIKVIENLYDISMEDIDILQDQNKELQLLCESYKKDAERYRWLRHGDNDDLCYGVYSTKSSLFSDIKTYLFRNYKLDDTIDKYLKIDEDYYKGFSAVK